MIYPFVYEIPAILHRLGVEKAVICPGSRSAPLTLAFARYTGILEYVVSDERSAGFIALGMAMASRKPVVLICTSGTAALNMAPSVAEAFYQERPLIILTADRPPEMIDQWDGQTIRQKDLYGSHAKASYEFPLDYLKDENQWYIRRMISEAVAIANGPVPGPVHINVPFREPLYPQLQEPYTQPKSVGGYQRESVATRLSTDRIEVLSKEWDNAKNILLIAGQQDHDEAIIAMAESLTGKLHIPIIGEVTSNLHGAKDIIKTHDIIFWNGKPEEKPELKPDLLITIGKSGLSKSLKQLLRHHQPTMNWHIRQGDRVADNFQSITRVLPLSVQDFLEIIADFKPKDKGYKEIWQAHETRASQFLEAEDPEPWSELKAIKPVLAAVPPHGDLHLANSMPVRYAAIAGIPATGVRIFANRGTSGVDGCTSTALGTSLVSGRETWLLTGDVAFFYDRNAFWHEYRPEKMVIILFNNQGGGIFRLIDGPGSQPELKTHFETHQPLKGQHLAEEFGFGYREAHDMDSLISGLDWVGQKAKGINILEITTTGPENKKALETFKKTYNKQS